MMDDIVFTVYNIDRDITYTLHEGEEDTFGWLHIIEQRPSMKSRLDAIRYAVKNCNVAYWDSIHSINCTRERIYCLGADKTRPQMYMVVIVDYPNETEGKIITAWQMSYISQEDGDVITYVNKS